MSALSKDDYLKRYLSKDKEVKRKKKRQGEGKTSSLPRSFIVDDDIDVNALLPENLSNTLEEDVGDNDPTVVEFIDERPEHIKHMEVYRNDDRWRVLNETGDVKTSKQPSPRTSDSDSDQSASGDTDSDPSPIRRHDSNSDNSPVKHHRHDSDRENSPENHQKQNLDSDNSPLRTARYDSDNSPVRNTPQDRDKPGRGRHYVSGNDNQKRRADIEQHSGNDDSPSKRKQKRMPDVRERDYKDKRVDTIRIRHTVSVHLSSQDKKSSRDSEYIDQSPPKRQHKSRLFQSAQVDSDSDHSPPRRQRGRPESDQSKPRRQDHTRDDDQSPPRSQRPAGDTAKSPPKRQRPVGDTDQSPPRRQRPSEATGQSQGRRHQRAQYSDQSPMRKVKQNDRSPPRRKKDDHDFDQSPPRRKRPVQEYDASPQRRNKPAEDYDQSSPRRQHSDRDKPMKPQKTLSGATAGLSSAREMKAEADRLRRKETEAFNEIDDESLGRNAKTVFRDKSGRRRNLEEEKRQQSEEDARKDAEAAKYKEWGQGLKQKQLREEAVTDLLHEVDKPLARYKDDKDLDKMMRAQDREGDPMLQFMKTKKSKQATGTDKPRYKGPAPPPNRYNIFPGCRWDGVDRSNGFEKQLFAKMADRKATENIAHKWSVEEM